MPVYRKEDRSHLRGCSGLFDYAWYVERRGILPDEYAVHGSFLTSAFDKPHREILPGFGIDCQEGACPMVWLHALDLAQCVLLSETPRLSLPRILAFLAAVFCVSRKSVKQPRDLALFSGRSFLVSDRTQTLVVERTLMPQDVHCHGIRETPDPGMVCSSSGHV